MTYEKREVNLDEGTGPDGRMTMAEARAATIQPPMWRDRAYVLMPPWLVDQTPTLNEPDEFGELEYIDADDPIACARWFSAVETGWSWYVLAYDRATGVAHVFVTSPNVPEGEDGDGDVAELEATRTELGLPAVERDLLFHMCPLSKARARDQRSG
jgi:hypothetical protein